MSIDAPIPQPIHLAFNFQDRKVLVVGGGPVAIRRAKLLATHGASVHLVAPEVKGVEGHKGLNGLKASPSSSDASETVHLFHHTARQFEAQDLQGYFAVIAATNDSDTNQNITDLAKKQGVLVNCADQPEQSDFHFLATGQKGPITLSLHTGGASANAATQIRDELLANLDPMWPALIQIASQYRKHIQMYTPQGPDRQTLLKKLVDQQAQSILKDQGEQALRQHLNQIAGIPAEPTS